HYEVPRLEELIAPNVLQEGISVDSFRNVLREYFSTVQLAEQLPISERRKKSADPLIRNASEWDGDVAEWQRFVYTAERQHIDGLVEQLEKEAQAWQNPVEECSVRIHRLIREVHGSTTPEPLGLQFNGLLAGAFKTFQKRLYEEVGLRYKDDPELLYKLSFQECAKAKGWDALTGEKLVEALEKEQVPLQLFEEYTGKKVKLPEKKLETVQEVVEKVREKATRGSRLFRRERMSGAVENLEGNLKDAYALAKPGTILHADELMNERRTNAALRSVPFYTADGNLYFMRDGKPFWAITREPENLILRHIDEAFPLLTQNHHYYPDPEEAAEAIAASDTLLIDISQLPLAGSDNEWRYLAISTSPEGYNQLNAEGRKAAERAFGSGDDFIQNMQMLHDARINDTKIFLLNPAYVAQHASQRVLGRGSWLSYFYDDSCFGGYGRSIYGLARLRGVRRSRR
ncbi:hypothetical protein HYS49_03575, partial [Candidatus Woesearchaeota archaeon]|nr:hypothetical protein [Candidatus Woesearchaeota archaeon]